MGSYEMKQVRDKVQDTSLLYRWLDAIWLNYDWNLDNILSHWDLRIKPIADAVCGDDAPSRYIPQQVGDAPDN